MNNIKNLFFYNHKKNEINTTCIIIFIGNKKEMQTLPNEIIQIIFGYISKITDKRQFARTCKLYNNITKLQMKNINIKLKIKYDYYPNIRYKRNKYCIENFMIELCHDSYFDMIPTEYITKSNIMIVRMSIIYNNIKLLQMAIDNGCGIFGRDCCIAIEYGHLDILKLLIKYGARWDYTYGTLASELGHLNILIWVKENGLYLKFDNLCSYAIQNGHLNILEWCVNSGTPMHKSYCELAAEYGHLEILLFLLKKDCKLGNSYRIAEENKQTNITDWLKISLLNVIIENYENYKDGKIEI